MTSATCKSNDSNCEDNERFSGACGGPPKKAIANGFACGSIPAKFCIKWKNGSEDKIEEFTIKEEDLMDILCTFLSPTKACGCCFACMGGAHKSLRGHFFFCETNLEAVGGTMELFRSTDASPHVCAVLCGRMTRRQKELARQ